MPEIGKKVFDAYFQFILMMFVVGQRIRLSKGDILQTTALYQCPSCGRTYQVTRSRVILNNGTHNNSESNKY